jgi:RNA polymerase sigma-70 factor (ECF subfamily)
MADALDVRLHVRLVARDELVLGEIYDAHAATVYGLARRVIGDAAAAEDIVQEVFLRLWHRPEDFDPDRGGLRTWLCTVARRRAIDLLRRGGTARKHLERLGADHPVASDISDAAIGGLVGRQVRVAVLELPEPQRTAVMLAYYDGLSYRQVAERLGIPEGTAKSRLRGALKSLAARLRREGVVD